MNPKTIPTKIFERLYRAALRLERKWANVEMSALFLPNRIEETWGLLTRKGIDPAWTEDECATHAERLLHYVWNRNAARDYDRQQEARAKGKRGFLVSLDLPGLENHPALWVHLDDQQSRDPWDCPLFHDLARELMRRHIPEKQVWAFYWSVVAQEEWNEVAQLLEARLGVTVQPNALRQWPVRNFPRIVAELRALLSDADETPVQPQHTARPTPTRARSLNGRAGASAGNRATGVSQKRVTRRR
jgi:hypothetical protein